MEPVVFEKVKMVSGKVLNAVWMVSGVFIHMEENGRPCDLGVEVGGVGLILCCIIALGTKGFHIQIRWPAAISASFSLLVAV
jgi:hypothetical protein